MGSWWNTTAIMATSSRYLNIKVYDMLCFMGISQCFLYDFSRRPIGLVDSIETWCICIHLASLQTCTSCVSLESGFLLLANGLFEESAHSEPFIIALLH